MLDDEAKLVAYAQGLAEAIEPAIARWVADAVARRAPNEVGGLADEVAIAGTRASAELMPRVRAVLSADIDKQTSTPLAELRRIVPFAAEVLERNGVAPVGRDPHAESIHPDDVYDLTPGGFNDFGEAVQQAGIAWGAAKAHIHLSRRTAEGRR